MAKIFCVANQKGGVGKTTTTVNLAAALARIGQRVLLVDLDPQGNATMGSGIDKRSMALSVYDVLLESAGVAEAALPAGDAGYQVLGANRELAGAEVELVDLPHRDQRLRQAIDVLFDAADAVDDIQCLLADHCAERRHGSDGDNGRNRIDGSSQFSCHRYGDDRRGRVFRGGHDHRNGPVANAQSDDPERKYRRTGSNRRCRRDGRNRCDRTRICRHLKHQYADHRNGFQDADDWDRVCLSGWCARAGR